MNLMNELYQRSRYHCFGASSMPNMYPRSNCPSHNLATPMVWNEGMMGEWLTEFLIACRAVWLCKRASINSLFCSCCFLFCSHISIICWLSKWISLLFPTWVLNGNAKSSPLQLYNPNDYANKSSCVLWGHSGFKQTFLCKNRKITSTYPNNITLSD